MRYNNNYFEGVFTRRMLGIGILKGGLFALLAGRIGWLQLIEGKKYYDLSEGNRIDVRFTLPSRGRILTEDLVPIADTDPKFELILIPYRVKSLKDTLSKLSKLTEIPNEKMSEIEAMNRHIYRYTFIPIKTLSGWEEAMDISSKLYDIVGIDIKVISKRIYPFENSFCHLTGYIGSVSQKDKINDKDPILSIPSMKIGKQGLEKTYDIKLRGKQGEHHLEVSNVGSVKREINHTPYIKGKDIYTSINSEVQNVAIESMGEQSGATILMNIKTGNIISMASTPGFNPNLFIDGISHDDWNKLRNNEKAPMNNKAIIGQYPPGSTFKMITLIAALEAGVIKKDDTIKCSGSYKLGKSKFHCWKYSGHGNMNAISAISNSCDVYFYELALKVGIKKIASIARAFGLGSKTNISLPFEKSGLIADPQWKKKRYGKSWTKGETIISSIGQGSILTTPLQLAVMTSRLASGKMVSPNLIPKETDFQNIDIDKQILKIIHKGMFDTVNSNKGTAPLGRIDSKYGLAAGKTGTAQVRRISKSERKSGVRKNDELEWKYRDHALYVSFAPYNDPLLAVATVIEHGGSGSKVATPIATKVLNKGLEIYL